MAGPHAQDPTAEHVPVPRYFEELDQPLGCPRVGFSTDFGWVNTDPAVAEQCLAAADVLRSLGCHVVEHDTTFDLRRMLPAKYLVGDVSVAIAVDKLSSVRDPAVVHEALCEYVKDPVAEGRRVSAAEYAAALAELYTVRAEVQALFADYDLFLTPTTSLPAYPAGAGWPSYAKDFAAFTWPFNISGFPAATVPYGFASDNRPIGLQIVGRPWEEGLVLRACNALERALPTAHDSLR
jgi:Asp-tRNA(Asn)/Glu-tRNA(Gln) amidotransferase A subunit family amidase